MTGYTLRPLTPADAGLVGRHRAAMLLGMGTLREAEAPRMVALAEAFVRGLLLDGSYVGFATAPERDPARVVGGAGVWLRPSWPWVRDGGVTPAGLSGLVLNVFVEPAHRRRGLARALMLAVEAACADRGVAKLTLHASDMGRPVYESLGYEPSNEMRLPGPPRRR